MLICNNLVHPFQNDAGCSQSQRVMEELLAGAAKIDGRTLAGLLNYFTELSPHIKYYYANETNTSLKNDTSWQLFFSETLPFIVAAASKNDTEILKDKFGLYSQLFAKAPSANGLQLLVHFFYYNTIYKINNLYVALKDSGLPVEAVLNQLIKNKLKGIASDFIRTSFTAYQLFGIRYIDFTFLFDKWGIVRDSLLTGDEAIKAMPGKVQQLVALQKNVVANFSAAIETVAIIADAANASLQQSLVPLKESLQQKHTPHIALLLTFLEVFSKLQQDLNGYTKKHLDFFYQDVLRLKPTNAQPDKVHIVFALQKQLQQYLLKKGLLAKADKDKNNTEINFALDEEMVVNKAQVKDVRTLFVNNQHAGGQLYAEGVYMAPNANTADGVSIDFKEGPKNYATLGGKLSKYTPPGKLFAQPYPAARIGFMLASPVLLLNEGERTIDITLVCKLDDTCNITSSVVSAPGDICCKDENLSIDKKIPVNGKAVDVANKAIKLIAARNLFEGVKEIVGKAYVYISEPLLLQAKQQGLSDPQATAISEKFIQVEANKKDAYTKPLCCSHIIAYEEEVIVEWDDWKDFLNTNNFSVPQQDFLFGIFKPFTPLKVLLSGEKDWIDPMDDINKPLVDINNQPVAKDGLTISMSDIDGNGQFTISIAVKIIAGKPPITFYNKDVLKEDLGTSLPLVKIGLDDTRKLALIKEMYSDAGSADAGCCFKNTENLCSKFVSLYQFFRQVVVVSSNIKVKV
ncbi:MAG: hypothetical protein H7334_06290, partial [Ferruginibacter sp.]|nr:hypothetical protein [Ferruginibacter sp.]